MKQPVTTRSLVYCVVAILVLQLALNWMSWQTAEAKGEEEINGRYQVSAYGGITSVGIGNGKGVPRAINGYVIIDTTTGEVVKRYSKMRVD